MNKSFLFFILGLSLVLGGCSQKFQRGVKDFQSKWVGLDRKVTVFSATGEPVRTYEGRIDIEPTEYGNKIKFAHDGNMVLIYNMGVVIEEVAE
ncbi:hypothetical protein INT08_10010 [Prosthecochloris sp. N3]|uniref:DUF5052 domain-containing protein n=1 Tax=Prosthecochloris ethylica TaxID=2743976 RepID=A0ABR9XTW6_9CHLB|nr:hypothetical protein [Prosthecochloris sp. ZM_2]MBF0587277.1 hypothetical protein [Prosthecochloris ethylica]MBF0637501.1 hypothetical protein [Prosthecochloris ethylica]NUK48085.1 hypothetical protein [Prosthecochloris ethylica]RNA66091.1 hypothetical protein CR163_001000 [Prosthecochloris sp. ZM_2]RNA66384.1 hypothetical protein CR163_000720 [Prosthecochloris sp. ZM_2]